MARSLAIDLGLPLLSKDVIKEALFDCLGVGDVDWSKQLGRASVAAMLAIARETPASVLESFWDPAHAARELGGLDADLIEVFCSCAPDTARGRFAERNARDRHRGHLDDQRIDDFDRWIATGRGEPLRLGGPLLEIRTDDGAPAVDAAGWVRDQREWKSGAITRRM